MHLWNVYSLVGNQDKKLFPMLAHDFPRMLSPRVPQPLYFEEEEKTQMGVKCKHATLNPGVNQV